MEIIIVAAILGTFAIFSLLGWLLPTDSDTDSDSNYHVTVRDGEIVTDVLPQKEANHDHH